MLASMKIWMKYLIGALIGAAIALVLPEADAGVSQSISFLFELSIRIGRYVLIPFVFFSLPIAIFELNEDGEFWRSFGKALLLFLLSIVAFTFIGVAVATIFRPGRIPLVAAAQPLSPPPNFKDLLLSIFPQSLFSVLNAGDFLLPVYFLSILLGLAFSHDHSATKPVVQLFDSFSRIFYQINSFFVEFLGIIVILVSTYSIFVFRAVLKNELFRPLLLVVGLEVLGMSLLVLPAALYFFYGKKNPYRYIYGLLAPALAALVSGDIYFPLGPLMKHAKESLGIRRRGNALFLPLAAIFGRAGTALVTATTFIVVLSSYSNLGISAGSLLWILATAPLLTLLLGATPGKGAVTALISLCALYGRGFENGYLIVVPVALPLAAAGAFLDCLWAGVASLILSKHAGTVQEKETRFYI